MSEKEKIVRVGVGIWILNPSGQLLLGQRLSVHGNGTWAPPGGHLEYGETMSRCASRELMEETGIIIPENKFHQIGLTNDIFPDKHYITIHCAVSGVVAVPQIMEPNKCAEWRWFNTDKLPSNLFLPAQNFLNQYKLQKIFNPLTM